MGNSSHRHMALREITVVLSTDLTERESTSSVTEMLSHSIILLSFLLTKRATHIKKKR